MRILSPSRLCAVSLGLAMALASTALAQTGPGGPPGGAPAGSSAGGPPPGVSTGGPPGGLALPPVDHSFDDIKPSPNAIGFGGVFPPLAKPEPANAPQPSSDPRNLEGAWVHTASLSFFIDKDIAGLRPPYNARGHHLLAKRLKSIADSKPFLNASSTCRPPGLPWQQDLHFPFMIFQSKNRFDVLYQEYHALQTIYMSPADAPKTPSYMGTSIGHWDGDTLVVVTKGMKNPIWIDVDGTPASANAVITQRIRKVNDGPWSLRIETTLDDPTYYTHPWSWERDFSWRPEQQIFSEYDCETQVGDKTNDANAGLIPEPADDDKP